MTDIPKILQNINVFPQDLYIQKLLWLNSERNLFLQYLKHKGCNKTIKFLKDNNIKDYNYHRHAMLESDFESIIQDTDNNIFNKALEQYKNEKEEFTTDFERPHIKEFIDNLNQIKGKNYDNFKR